MNNPHLMPLSLQEIASFAGFTHFAYVNADDLTMATTNTLQTIRLAVLPIGSYVTKAEMRLAKPFKDASDAAFNSTTMSLGDSGAVDTFLTARQMNENGTEIVVPGLLNTATGPYTAADHVSLTVNSMSAKALLNIDVGELHILVGIFIPKVLSDAKAFESVLK